MTYMAPAMTFTATVQRRCDLRRYGLRQVPVRVQHLRRLYDVGGGWKCECGSRLRWRRRGRRVHLTYDFFEYEDSGTTRPSTSARTWVRVLERRLGQRRRRRARLDQQQECVALDLVVGDNFIDAGHVMIDVEDLTSTTATSGSTTSRQPRRRR